MICFLRDTSQKSAYLWITSLIFFEGIIGNYVREKLSEAVEKSLKLLPNGLLKHPSNSELQISLLAAFQLFENEPYC